VAKWVKAANTAGLSILDETDHAGSNPAPGTKQKGNQLLRIV
jgi:hypothetical protein